MLNLAISSNMDKTYLPKVNVNTTFRSKSASKPDNAEHNSKKDNNNNKLIFGFLTGALILAGSIIAYIKLHKTKNIKPSPDELSPELKEVQKLYKAIFKRDINKEETKTFAKRYKKIIDSYGNNNKEYCEKLLDEICKDRQTNRPRINRWIENAADVADQRVRQQAAMQTSPDGSYIDVYVFNYRNVPNIPTEKGLFESLFHETHHVKQDEIIYRTDKNWFIEHVLNKFIDNGEGTMYRQILERNGGNEERAINEARTRITQQVDRYWGRFEPFAEGSAEYQEGLKLIEGKKKYKFFGDCASDEEYQSQIIEKGAYADGNNAYKLFDLLKHLRL